MKNSKSVQQLVMVVVGVIVLFVIFGHLIHKASAPVATPQPVASYSGDTADLVSVSIAPGQAISGTLAFTGSLRGAYFFEATARGMLLDSEKNVIKSFPLTATGEWMTSDPVSFTATIDTTGVMPGSGYVRLENDNASGDPSRDKYVDIPVVFE